MNVENKVEFIVGYSSLGEFINHTIGCWKQSREDFQKWLTENTSLDKNDDLVQYANNSLNIIGNRLKRLELANKQLNQESKDDLAKKELVSEISLRENILTELSKSGIVQDNEYFTPSNVILIAQQMFQDDLEGVERENYGVPFLL